jgi:hypothetical protein
MDQTFLLLSCTWSNSFLSQDAEAIEEENSTDSELTEVQDRSS